MHKIVLTIAALGLGLGTSAAFAQTPTTFADVDADASGELSFPELLVAWPDLKQDEFNAADIDLSGGLSTAELGSLQPGGAPSAAVPAETLPAPDVAPVESGAETMSGASSDN